MRDDDPLWPWLFVAAGVGGIVTAIALGLLWEILEILEPIL